MANYCNGYDTHFTYPTFELNADQKSVLDKWYGYDLSYINMNQPEEFLSFATQLNEVFIPSFELEFVAFDEERDKWWVEFDYEKDKWCAWYTIYGEVYQAITRS